MGDLETLARDTHKFESRYLDWLVGPYPEARERYVERRRRYPEEPSTVLDEATVERLRALGHTVVERGDVSGDVQAILVTPNGLAAWSDPRRGGVARGY